MIYTVTLNPAIDKTVEIAGFAVDAVNRVARMRMDPGGKGLNVSRVIESLGGYSCALAVLGGNNGARLCAMLDGRSFRFEKICGEGETRTNLKIVDPVLHTNTDINEPGSCLGERILSRTEKKLEAMLGPEDILVLSGSVPPGTDCCIYRRLIETAHAKKARTLVDADGPLFAEALKGRPFLVKPNLHELEQWAGCSLCRTEDIRRAGERLLQQGATQALISMGGEGAMLCTETGCMMAEGLSVPVISTVGAGDSMVAAFAWGLEQKMNAEDILRLSVAAGTAAVSLPGTQAPERGQVEKLRAQVKLCRL